MSLSDTRRTYAMTSRLVEGFIRITMFLAGGPLVALPAEPEPVETDPPFVVRLLVSVLSSCSLLAGWPLSWSSRSSSDSTRSFTKREREELKPLPLLFTPKSPALLLHDAAIRLLEMATDTSHVTVEK
jgi:hypothetical protein